MTEQNIKRFSLWLAHGGRCRYCSEPFPFAYMTTDHIIPKRLKEEPEKLKDILKICGLPENFDLESYENWIPCHQKCNREKTGMIFEINSIVFFINIAKQYAEKAIKIEENILTKRMLEQNLATIGCLIEEGIIDKDCIEIYLKETKPRDNDQIVISFGVTYEEIENKREIPGIKECSLDDWLKQDLIKNLKDIVSSEFYICEEGDSGDCLSIRVAFKSVNPEEIYQFKSPWWEMLEVDWYSDIYEEMPDQLG
jgi:hypothetical protein